MKGILAVVAIIPFVLCSCTIRVEAQNCGPIPFFPCALAWRCTSDSGWVVTKGEQPGTPCATVYGGKIDGTCQGSASKFGSTVMCVPSPPPPLYKIGGTVSGLAAGNTVTLLDNGGSQLSIMRNGGFTFATGVLNATGYNVTFENQPSGQICTVSSGMGKIQGANVTNVAVQCITPPDIAACDHNGCVSEAQICANVSQSLENPPQVAGVTPPPVVGYVCIAGNLPPVYGGVARTATDSPATPMSPNEKTNIGSVSKTMTATAILQLLDKNGLTINDPISPYIYKDWVQGPYINQITFRELLTHRSGFGQLLPATICGNGHTYSELQTIVANGFTTAEAANIGKPSYGNCNFALLRELMPALLGQSPTCSISIFGGPPLGINPCYPYGAQRAEMSSTLYINYMNTEVFQPVGVPASTCKPPVGSTEHMLSYPLPAGTTPGTDWGDWSLMCGAAGWNLSANQIFSVINGVANGNALLTNAEKLEMFADCLGWDCAGTPPIRSDCPFPPYVCKNGYFGPPDNTIKPTQPGNAIWTYAGILSCSVPVVVVVNSPTPPPFAGFNVPPANPPGSDEAPDIIDLVANAYSRAAVPGAPQRCP